MKIIFLKIVALAAMITFLNFSFSSSKNSAINLSGKWKLTIDKQIDGVIQGNHGCDEITFTAPKDNLIRGEYSNCSGSNNAKSSEFKGEVFVSDRGNLVTFLQINKPTDYFATWSGLLIDKGTIKGIWTDVDGNQGEFKLTR